MITNNIIPLPKYMKRCYAKQSYNFMYNNLQFITFCKKLNISYDDHFRQLIYFISNNKLAINENLFINLKQYGYTSIPLHIIAQSYVLDDLLSLSDYMSRYNVLDNVPFAEIMHTDGQRLTITQFEYFRHQSPILQIRFCKDSLLLKYLLHYLNDTPQVESIVYSKMSTIDKLIIYSKFYTRYLYMALVLVILYHLRIFKLLFLL